MTQRMHSWAAGVHPAIEMQPWPLECLRPQRSSGLSSDGGTPWYTICIHSPTMPLTKAVPKLDIFNSYNVGCWQRSVLETRQVFRWATAYTKRPS